MLFGPVEMLHVSRSWSHHPYTFQFERLLGTPTMLPLLSPMLRTPPSHSESGTPLTSDTSTPISYYARGLIIRHHVADCYPYKIGRTSSKHSCIDANA